MLVYQLLPTENALSFATRRAISETYSLLDIGCVLRLMLLTACGELNFECHGGGNLGRVLRVYAPHQRRLARKVCLQKLVGGAGYLVTTA